MISSVRNFARKLLSLEIFFVSGAVLASMAANQALTAALGVAVFFWIARLVSEPGTLPRTQADWAVLVLLLISPVSVWASIEKSTTITNILRLLVGIGLFYAIVSWATTKPRIRTSVAILAMIGVGLSLIAPFSVEWTATKLTFIPSSIYDQFTRLVSDSIHRNVFAGYLLILFPPVISYLWFSWKEMHRNLRVLLLLSAAFVLTMFFLAQSRGALIASGVILLTLTALRYRYGWSLIPVGFLGIILIFLAYGTDQVLDFIAAGVSVEGIDGRMELWSRGVYMIQDFPITGIGMGLYGHVADLLYPFFLAPPGSIDHSHNLFLQIAVDLGIPGLVAWLAIFLLVIRSAWRTYHFGRISGSNSAAGLGAGLLAAQLALAVHGLVDAVTWGMVKPAPLLWAVWALAFAAENVFVLSHYEPALTNIAQVSAQEPQKAAL